MCLIEPITPDKQDYETVEKEHGRRPANASDAEAAYRYQLAQAAKLIRLYGNSET